MTCPCKNCTDRALHCHSTCPKYIEYKDKLVGISSARVQENDQYSFNKAVKRNLIKGQRGH